MRRRLVSQRAHCRINRAAGWLAGWLAERARPCSPTLTRMRIDRPLNQWPSLALLSPPRRAPPQTHTDFPTHPTPRILRCGCIVRARIFALKARRYTMENKWFGVRNSAGCGVRRSWRARGCPALRNWVTGAPSLCAASKSKSAPRAPRLSRARAPD